MATIWLLAALSLAGRADATDSNRLNKDEETISWTLTAASKCPSLDKDNRWLDGTCVQLVTKVAGSLLRSFVPDANDVVKALLEVVRCERGQKSSGGTAPFLAGCVERKTQTATKALAKWKEQRAKSPDVPNEVPDAQLPQADTLFR